MGTIIVDNKDLSFTQEEINGFLRTYQYFIDGKTTARDREDIERELEAKFGQK